MADALTEGLERLELADLPAECQVIIQETCALHRFARPSIAGALHEAHDAEIVERPERMKAAQVGIAGAFARLSPNSSHNVIHNNIRGTRFDILFSSARLRLDSPAVSFAHGGHLREEDAVYPAQLRAMIAAVRDRHAVHESEIPAHLPQGDLYLHAESIEAIEGALGAVCEAVDSVALSPGLQTRFVTIRPPGHHCSADTPAGFCFVNNVLVAAAHAYLEHDFDRIVVFDIDLHHGDGSQKIVWAINDAAKNAGSASKMATPKSSPGKAGANTPGSKRKRPLKMCYASVHDILSYPCEDGVAEIVTNASVKIDGSHGQYISNCHLEPYTSVAQFHSEIYPKYREGLIGAASSFLKKSQADPSKTLFFVSAGFDASEHEYPSMSRHHRRVPTSFYARFAQDLKCFASDPSSYVKPAVLAPKIVACLEGGYSDRAISSGIASFLSGIVAGPGEKLLEWDLKEIQLLEKGCCSNPPMGKKTLADWALKAGNLYGLLSKDDRSAWDRSSKETSPISMRQPSLREKRQVKTPVYYAEEASPPRKPARPRNLLNSAALPHSDLEEEFKAKIQRDATSAMSGEDASLHDQTNLPLKRDSSSSSLASSASLPDSGDDKAGKGNVKLVWLGQSIA